MKWVKAFHLILLILTILSFKSCGKVIGDDVDGSVTAENECEYRWVASQQCIVCSKGGVSCKWD